MQIPSLLHREHIGHLEKMLFTRHLSTMLKSGLSLGEAIAILSSQATNATIRRLTLSIQKDIDNGKTLSSSLAMHPTIFDSLYIRFVALGEESGTLQKNLEYLAVQQKKSYAFQKKIKGAMIYPTIVFIAASLAAMGISLFVLPQLITLFDSLDVTLPLSTKILIFIANIMKNFGILIFAAFFLLILSVKYLTNLPRFQTKWHSFLLSLPVLGSFLQNVEIALFCRNVGMMLQAGMPITTILEAQVHATKNRVFQQYFETLLSNVEKGKSLEETFTKGSFKHIPLLVGKMIGVGEKTGKLEESLLYLSDFFEDEVDEASRNLTASLEPFVLLVVGVIVAFVAYAIISPIYQFTGGIK